MKIVVMIAGDSSLVNKEVDSSSDCFLRARVTPYSLTKDRLVTTSFYPFLGLIV